MIFLLKIMLDIIYGGYNVGPNRVPFNFVWKYSALCKSVRQPITEVKAEWNVAADVREIDSGEGGLEFFRKKIPCFDFGWKKIILLNGTVNKLICLQ